MPVALLNLTSILSATAWEKECSKKSQLPDQYTVTQNALKPEDHRDSQIANTFKNQDSESNKLLFGHVRVGMLWKQFTEEWNITSQKELLIWDNFQDYIRVRCTFDLNLHTIHSFYVHVKHNMDMMWVIQEDTCVGCFIVLGCVERCKAKQDYKK